jgi:DNA topoisomerase-3
MKRWTDNCATANSVVELITLMDRNGIGTDATIAQHISTIQDRNMLKKDGNQKFHPTKLGLRWSRGITVRATNSTSPIYDVKWKPNATTWLLVERPRGNYGSHSGKDAPVTGNGNSGKRTLDEAVARHFPRLGSSNTTTQDASQLYANAASVITKWQSRDQCSWQQQHTMKRCTATPVALGGTYQGDVQPKTEGENGGLQSSAPFATNKFSVMRGEGYEGNGYHVCPK